MMRTMPEGFDREPWNLFFANNLNRKAQNPGCKKSDRLDERTKADGLTEISGGSIDHPPRGLW